MKRVLLLSLGLLMGFAGFAQVSSVKNSEFAKQSVLTQIKPASVGTEVLPASNFTPAITVPQSNNAVVTRGNRDIEEFEDLMVTNYDLQSNSALGNRIAAWADGSVAAVATWGQGTTTSPDNRGTGYNYYDGNSFGDAPNNRIESSFSGWPSICAYGDGEILASHGGGNVNVYYRATKGEGSWTQTATITGWTWPRVACTEDGTLHIICAEQDSNNTLINYIGYFTSTDGGTTWTQVDYFTQLSEEYNHLIGADDYIIAVNGNRIAIMFTAITYDMFYVISEDAGATWTKNVICAFPYGVFDWNQTSISSATDSIWWSDNSGSIAIGNDGTVHATWGLSRWAPSIETAGSYNYWPYTVGIVYWNSNYTNENGGHEIQAFGEWSGDADHPEWLLNGTNGVANTMLDERIDLIAAQEGNCNLHLFGWASEANPGQEADWSQYYSNDLYNAYRTIGISTMPAIAVDGNNNVIIAYTSLSDKYTIQTASGEPFYTRRIFAIKRTNAVWELPTEATSLSDNSPLGIVHEEEEAYSLTSYPNKINNAFWFTYFADGQFGLFLDSDQGTVTDNIMYAMKLTNIFPDDNVSETHDVVYNIYPNPAKDYICISADSNAEATITFVNLAGQTVKSINKSLTMGQNTISIDLESGVYFCTVNANGFSKTTKVVVK